MNEQCSQQRLQLAMAGMLSADEETNLHRHLDTCEACAEALDQLSGGAPASEEIARMLTPDGLDDTLCLREDGSTADFVVDHLEPADDPQLLGRLGGYDVLEVIGRGGMGVVLKGYDRELKRFVAIKALSPHLAHSALARKRFAREAQAAAAVVNPHVIAIHQVQSNGRLPFLVMPLLTGESLAQRLRAKGSLELAEVLRVGMQAADGLAAAHAQGLIHRDVKPANILLEKGVERAVLTDFGLARAADDVSLTRQGIIAGTPEYMSPEQARGEALDGRSDLFSLGCVLYEMATGVSPFRTDSTLATLRRIVEEQPASMASRVPELPPWFCRIVERLLSKQPAQRFASATEVKRLLELCLSHLQQPSSVPLPAVLLTDASPSETNVRALNGGMAGKLTGEAMLFHLKLFGDMLLARPIRVQGSVGGIGAANNGRRFASLSPRWQLILLPLWFFGFVTPIQTMLDVMNLSSVANGKSADSSFTVIVRILVYAFEAFLFGVIAAQFAVPVTPPRWLRPLVALWILVIPYLLARQLANLIAERVGEVFSLTSSGFTSGEVGTYLVIAITSAVVYSLVIRRDPDESPPALPANELSPDGTVSTHSVDVAEQNANFYPSRRTIMAAIGVIIVALLGVVMLPPNSTPGDSGSKSEVPAVDDQPRQATAVASDEADSKKPTPQEKPEMTYSVKITDGIAEIRASEDLPFKQTQLIIKQLWETPGITDVRIVAEPKNPDPKEQPDLRYSVRIVDGIAEIWASEDLPYTQLQSIVKQLSETPGITSVTIMAGPEWTAASNQTVETLQGRWLIESWSESQKNVLLNGDPSGRSEARQEQIPLLEKLPYVNQLFKNPTVDAKAREETSSAEDRKKLDGLWDVVEVSFMGQVWITHGSRQIMIENGIWLGYDPHESFENETGNRRYDVNIGRDDTFERIKRDGKSLRSCPGRFKLDEDRLWLAVQECDLPSETPVRAIPTVVESNVTYYQLQRRNTAGKEPRPKEANTALKIPQSIEAMTRVYNDSTARLRRDLFPQSIPDLTVEQMKAGLIVAAEEQMKEGRPKTAEVLQKLAETGVLPISGGYLFSYGTHEVDQNGDTISRLIVPTFAIASEDSSKPEGEGGVPVVLKSMSLKYTREGYVSQTYEDPSDRTSDVNDRVENSPTPAED